MLENKEIWRDCKGYEGIYQVSNFGRVWSVQKQKYLAQYDGSGYLKVDLYAKNGKRKKEYVHRLVALNFIGEPPADKTHVNHKDENKHNNYVENLEWCDQKYNNNYGTFKDRARERMSHPVYCIELDKYFKSGKEAAQFFGSKTTHGIYGCCHNAYGYRTAFGYHWRFADGNELAAI